MIHGHTMSQAECQAQGDAFLFGECASISCLPCRPTHSVSLPSREKHQGLPCSLVTSGFGYGEAWVGDQ